MINFEVLISFLPVYVIFLIFVGNAANSPSLLGAGANSQDQIWLQELELTPQQVTKLKTIAHQYQKQAVGLIEKLNLAEKQFNHLMVGTTPASQIRNRQRQLEDLKLQTAEVLFAESLAIREVLTPEQRQQLSDRFLR